MAGWQDGIEASIEWIVDRVLEAVARDDEVEPAALLLLVRRYVATDRADLADALGPALARGLDRIDQGRGAPAVPLDSSRDAQWLMLFVEVCPLSEDDRLRTAAAGLVARLGGAWPRVVHVEPPAELMRSIEARLAAASVLDPRELVPGVIDELERVIGSAYTPGDGIAHDLTNPDALRGRLDDHVRAASALLTAYELTTRLPYAMLAEELIQFSRRASWDPGAGGFHEEETKPFALNCEGSRVLCRLAALHREKEYRDAAILAPGADYGRDAARTLEMLASTYREHGPGAAIYGIALGEWLALESGSHGA